MRLVVEAAPPGSTQPVAVADAATRTIRVKLPPAASFPAVLSSMLAPGDEDLLGQWRWYTERLRADEEADGAPAKGPDTGGDVAAGPVADALAEGAASDIHELLADAASTAPADRFGPAGTSEEDERISTLSAAEHEAALRAALTGRIGQLTPATGLTMVHAVRCPVAAPAFAGPRVLREPGQTVYALADPAMTVHGASTRTVHADATWTEYSDLTGDRLATSTASAGAPPGDRPSRRPRRADAPEHAVPEPSRPRGHPPPPHHLHARRRFAVRAVLHPAPYGRPQRQRAHGGRPGLRAGDGRRPGRRPGAQRRRHPGPPRRDVRVVRMLTVDDGEGEITRIAGGAIPNGASVEVSYVVPPVTRAGPPVTLHVPSTVRPPAPVVHSVVPAFAWERTTAGSATTSVRHEGTVRVHLKRPWYLTGEGELLGVRVVDATTSVDPSVQKWATAWGRDPIRARGDAPVMAYPTPANLDERAVDVRLDQGHALGFPVDYDRQRQLWYADVRFKGDSLYQPFVHLMVVRLQPDSLTAPEDLRASPVVDAGWVQLPAYRRARIVVGGTAAGSPVKVTVVAPEPPPGADGLTSEFTACVQFRTPLLPDDAGWMELDDVPPVRMNRAPGAGPIGVWTQEVRLPAAVGARPMRVVVREYDVLTDSPEPGRTTRRISYLDTIPI